MQHIILWYLLSSKHAWAETMTTIATINSGSKTSKSHVNAMYSYECYSRKCVHKIGKLTWNERSRCRLCRKASCSWKQCRSLRWLCWITWFGKCGCSSWYARVLVQTISHKHFSTDPGAYVHGMHHYYNFEYITSEPTHVLSSWTTKETIKGCIIVFSVHIDLSQYYRVH